LLHGASPEDFGFLVRKDTFKQKDGRYTIPWSTQLHLGFESDASRTTSFKKAKAWLAEQKPKKEEPKSEAAFLKAAGDDEPARALLAEVLKDTHGAKVLDEAVQHPERSAKLYAAEQWRLWQKAVSTPPGAKEADIPTAPEIALSFLLGAHPSTANALKTEPPPNDARISEGRRAVESDLLCKSLHLELIDPKRRGPLARLMAGWMAVRADPW